MMSFKYENNDFITSDGITIKIWDCQNYTVIKQIKLEDNHKIFQVEYSPDDLLLFLVVYSDS